MTRPARLLITSALICALGAPALAAPQTAQVAPPATAALASSTASEMARFTPRPSKTTRLDYGLWNDALKEFVFYGGPSLRVRELRPRAVTGSRLVLGHTSPFRMEGNKVAFEGMRREIDRALSDYVDDLERIGNQIDIPSLSRDEQLAYWLNLHNALIVSEIASRYPVKHPRTLRGIDGQRLHDAKYLEIDDVKLSLRDIREQIVYKHWSDPRVIYGFFLGELGGPSLQRAAYDGETVWSTLTFSAQEFASSLRGVETYGDGLRVSKIYQDVAPFYFADFQRDVRAHLVEFGSEASIADIQSSPGALSIGRYEDVIADLTAGDGNREPLAAVESFGPDGEPIDQSALGRAMREQGRKYQKLRERGLTGTVFIEDIETEQSEERPAQP